MPDRVYATAVDVQANCECGANYVSYGDADGGGVDFWMENHTHLTTDEEEDDLDIPGL